MADLIDRKALGIVRCNPDAFQPDKALYCKGWNSAIEILEAAPTVDAMQVSKELQAVVKRLEKEYSKAKSLKYVHDPLAFALYRVWRKVDGERKDDG